MFETIKEVDENIVFKENNIFLTREPTDSLLSGDVEYLDEIYSLLMIEVDLKKTKNPS